MSAAATDDYAHMPASWRRNIMEAALKLANDRYDADPDANYECANDAARLYALLQRSSAADAGFALVLRYDVVRDAIKDYFCANPQRR